MSVHNILLVEDDLSFGSVLQAYLEVNDFQVVWVDDGKYALRKFREENFDICILDVMLPNVDGFTIAREIRKKDKEVPMIFLTAKSMKNDVLEGFSIGADDYITKPFDSEVLLCKIKAILNRKSPQPEIIEPDNYTIGSYVFIPKKRHICRGTSEQKLTPKETELLKMLCKNKNSVMPREDALVTIWGDDNYFTTRSMDVFITKLRKYLREDSSVEIINIHGSGYILSAE